jgi:hypothetical protein
VKFFLTALAAALALYLVVLAVLALVHPPRCEIVTDAWWGSLWRCTVTVPLRSERGAQP